MFRVGDIVTGKFWNGYSILNDDMYEAEVISVNSFGEMKIKVLSHKDRGLIGGTWVVHNNDDFELVPKVEKTEQDLGDILKSLTDYMKKNNLDVVQGHGVMATTLNLVK